MAVTINADNGAVSGSAGLKSSADSTGVLALQTNGTTAVTVDTSQNVGIGTSSPTGKLHVSAPINTKYGTFDAVTSTEAYTVYQVGGTAYGYLGDASGLVSGGTAGNLAVRFSGAMVFSGGANERMRINSGAPILCLSGGSTTATGTGIAFPATQSASSDANTLDDYEEGTFTPTVVGTSTAGTATYGVQIGKYTKIGDRVLVNMYLSWNSGTGTGNMNVSGLPFASDNQITLANYNGGVAMAAGHVMQVITSSTLININSVPSGGGSDANVPYDSAGLLIIAGSYKI